MSRLLRATVLFVAVGVIASCSAEVRKADDADIQQPSEFTVMLRKFHAANNELQPEQEACNKGGLAQACGDSSLEIAELVESYEPRLESLVAEAPDPDAAADFVEALTLYAEGLRERTRGLAEQNNDLFVSGNDKVTEAATAWRAAETALSEAE